MRYLGLIPWEYTTCEQRRLGQITKTGWRPIGHCAVPDRALSPKPLADPLRDFLGRKVDDALPMEALQERRVRAVERLQVRPTGQSEVQRITVGIRGSAIGGEVEALESHFGVRVQRDRQSVSELRDQVVV